MQERHRGVTARPSGKWQVSLRHGGRQVHLGTYASLEEAKRARTDAELRLRGYSHDRREVELCGDVAEVPLHDRRGACVAWALVDAEDATKVGGIHWSRSGNGYAVGNTPAGRMTMHRWLLPEAAGLEIDHIDGNGLNNTRANLRPCNRVENTANTTRRSTNKSGFKGVCSDRRGRWRATITVNGKQRHLGSFTHPEQAARAYDTAAVSAWGAFAKTNESLGFLREERADGW